MRACVLAALALLAPLTGCGEKHEPVKLIARPPAAEPPVRAALPAAAGAGAMAAKASDGSASAPAAAAQALAASAPARMPPPPGLAPPARVHLPGEPTGNDAFREAIDARFRARAAAPPQP